MSDTCPARSRPLTTVGADRSLEQGAADWASMETAMVSAAELPFYVARFRSNFLQVVQHYFSSAANYPTGPDIPDISSLTYNPENPAASTLQVRLAFDSKPPASSHPAVFVRLEAMQFDKLVFGNRGKLSTNKSTEWYVKAMAGTVSILADHPKAEVSATLVEGLMVFLEASKWSWMLEAGMQAFDVATLSAAEQLQPDPEQVMRTTLACSFRGRLNVLKTTEALPLKRIVFNLDHS